MSRKYKISNQNALYFISFATVHWIDLLVRDEYREVILDSLRYCQIEKKLEVYSWCLMTSHVHLILGSTGGQLENIIRDFKRHTSSKLRKAIVNHNQESRREWIIWMMERAGRKNGNNSDWQLWQQHNEPIELMSNNVMTQKLDYIHMNPVESGFVSEPQHWKYSSAVDYSGGKGLLDIKYIE